MPDFYQDLIEITPAPECQVHKARLKDYSADSGLCHGITTDTPTQMPSQRIVYRKPPILERVLVIEAKIDEDTFYSQFEAWKHQVLESFPIYEAEQHWLVKVRQPKEGSGRSVDSIPFLDDAVPEVRIIHQFTRESRGGRSITLSFTEDAMRIHLHPMNEEKMDYKELEKQFRNWLPSWSARFSIHSAQRLVLEYANILGRLTTPQFMTENGSIRIGDVLNVFACPPGTHQGLIPPYDCHMCMQIDKDRGTRLNLRVNGVTHATTGEAAIQVNLQAITRRPGKNSISLQEIPSEAEFLHEVVLEKFHAVFTEKAKQSFEPIEQASDPQHSQ